MENAFKKIRSFTLVELMVVVIILSMVAGIVIPIYTQTVDRSKDRTARATARLFYYGQEIYQKHTNFYIAISEGAPDSTWEFLKLQNPNVIHAESGFKFSAETDPLKIKARRTKDSALYVVDENGVMTNPDGRLSPITE